MRGRARRMNLQGALRVGDDLRAAYESFGRPLDHADWEHPLPATFVIDRSGVIRYAHIDPDYTQRAEPSDVLQAVRASGALTEKPSG